MTPITLTFKVGGLTQSSVEIPAGNNTAVIEILPVGCNINAFVVQVKPTPYSDWQNYLGGVDFDSTSLPAMVFSTTTGPHEVAAGGTAFTVIRLEGIYAFRVTVTANQAGTATVRTFTK